MVKKYISPEQIINRLEKKGMSFIDKAQAKHFFERNNYYRFKSFFIDQLNDTPQDIKVGRTFQQPTTFERIKTRYDFDNIIRSVLLGALQDIELTLRETIVSTLSVNGGAFYYEINTYDNNSYTREKLNKFKSILKKNKKNSSRDFIKNANPLNLWAAVEILNFGNLINLIKIMKDTDKNKVSNFFGYKSSTLFINHMNFLCSLRNKCAHHEILWQHNFIDKEGVSPKIPAPWGYTQSQTNFIYNIILILVRIDNQSIKSKWQWQMFAAPILNKMDLADLLLGYGFTHTWTDEIKQIKEYINSVKNQS